MTKVVLTKQSYTSPVSRFSEIELGYAVLGLSHNSYNTDDGNIETFEDGGDL